jgi:hypothetical protein
MISLFRFDAEAFAGEYMLVHWASELVETIAQTIFGNDDP